MGRGEGSGRLAKGHSSTLSLAILLYEFGFECDLLVANPTAPIPRPPCVGSACSLPVSGVLSCDFVTRRVSKTLEVMQPRKFLALAAQFGSTSMSDKEKLALVEVREIPGRVLSGWAI